MQNAALALMLFAGLVLLVTSLKFIAPPPLRRWLINHTWRLRIAGILIGLGVVAYMAYSLSLVYR